MSLVSEATLSIDLVHVAFTLTGIAIGFFLGRLEHEHQRKHHELTAEKARLWGAVAIGIVWVCSLIADAALVSYETPVGVNVAFGTVTTYLFASAKFGNGNGKDKTEGR